jgi:hypothetical protein
MGLDIMGATSWHCFTPYDPDASAAFRRLRQEVFDSGQYSTTAESIDHLLELAGENGTHSILDITHLAARLDFAAAAPMLSSDLRRFFGTDQPTHEQAEDAVDDIGDELDWQAYYFVVYKDGRPAEYAFIGSSGD